ncbi:MAG: MFS transporter [Candidatus Rokubacteria bacterium]|nr:MFS transporter [Candidatus Rokubacteria bacterium]
MLGGVWALYFCFGLTTTALVPLVPVIATELRLSHAAMGGVLGVWPPVYIASAVPCGVVLDRLGLRWSLGLAAAVMGLSGLLRAVASDHLQLFLAVAVFGLIQSSAGAVLMSGLFPQGIARGSMTALAMLVLMDMRDVGSRNVGAAGGLFFAAAEIGGVLGPLTIGALYDWTGGFAAALYLLMAVCLVLMMLLRPLGRLDVRG